MPAVMENASSRLDDLHRIAIHAGSQSSHYDTFSNRLVCEDIDQATLDNAIATLPPRVITQEDVNAEWDRRVFGGFEFMGKVFASDIFSMNDICDHALWARDAMSRGAQAGDYKWHEKEEDFAWKAKDGTYMKMDAPTMVSLHVGMTMHKQAHFIAAQAIKAMTPIPSDYTSDTYWP